MRTRYHVAVRRPGDDAILVMADGAMPGFTLDDAPWWQVVTPVVDRMRDEHGLDVVALRTAWLGEPRADGTTDRLVEVAHRRGRLPAGARWIALADLERRESPLGQAIGEGVLAPAAGTFQPWYRHEWYEGALSWIDRALTDAGLRRHGPIRQVRSWGRSALLTVETDRGRVWAKQVPTVFAHEVAITGLLADVDPGIVPPVIAADPRTGRMLLEHVDGPLLADLRDDLTPWSAAMARLAEIQRVLAGDLGALRAAGVPTASLTDLADAVPRLLADPGLARVGMPGGLTPDDHEAIVAVTPDLVAACHALAADATGPSVEHGDLSGGQIVVGEMGPVFLDWSDATITHPFLAAASFLIDPADLPADAGPALAEAYLDGWGREPRAAQALSIASVVYPLHMAWLYAERILPGLDQRWEMDRMIPWALLRLRPRLADLPRILAG